MVCCKALQVARHNRLCDLWQRFYKESGAFAVYREQQVPELARDPTTIADLCVVESPGLPLRYLDVAVTHPIACRAGEWVGMAAGAACKERERDKIARCAPAANGTPVVFPSLAVESHGRWGGARL